VPARRYTDQQFLDAVADPEVRTVADLCRRLGIVPRGGNYEVVRRLAARLGVRIDTTQQRARQPLPDEAALREAVATSRSMAGVLRVLGLPDAGGTRARVRRAIDRHGLDTAHHQGQGWNRGQRDQRVRTRLGDLADGRARTGTTVKRVLLREGWPARCARCERETWLGGTIPLELDHIDGDRTNNEPTNLRLLCPNCHALTPTYRGRNIGRREEARRSPGGSS
jgi:5-methylcytosine-specific restriction endonuclease McrA